MVRVRLLLTWLLMAVTPLQGFAATTMLTCKGAEAAHILAAAQGHEAASFDHHDGHVMPSHGEPGQLGHVDGSRSQDPAASHQCVLCASCSLVVAISQWPVSLAFTHIPEAQSAEPFVLIQARAAPAPEKPPRA